MMNTRTVSTSSLVVVLPSLWPCLSFAGHERKEGLVAMVTGVGAPQKDIADPGTLWTSIHQPGRFGGFQFIVATESTNWAKIRANFPAGRLQILELPDKTLMELADPIDQHIEVQRMLDAGIDPARIFLAFTVPCEKFADPHKSPVAYTVNTEQSGAGQSATRSASDSNGGDKTRPESKGRSR
ncbi:MAG: hypothetical protein ACKV19_03355 [Verrucomicrobiales bacterium]